MSNLLAVNPHMMGYDEMGNVKLNESIPKTVLVSKYFLKKTQI